MTETRPVGDTDTDAPGTNACVPPPVPPDDPDAWYAPAVREQYELHPGVTATIRETETGFHYRVREPARSDAVRAAGARIDDHFADANLG